MNCDDARKRIHEAADGEADGALRTHLLGCEPCQAELKRHKQIAELLRKGSPDIEPSARFMAGLRAKLPVRSRILRILAPITAAAAALLIMFFSVFSPGSGPVASSYIDEEISRMSPEDRELFQALDENGTWDIAEQYELVHSMDAVSGDWPPAEEQK